MNVVGYVRVAMDCSVNEFLDREAQAASITQWARDHGHRIVDVFYDEGFDASSDLETRVGLGDALQLIRDRHVQGMVVARLDRLALSVILQEELLAEIDRDFPQFQSALRDLWVRHRFKKFETPDERAAEAFALMRAEELVHEGVEGREITGILNSEGLGVSHGSSGLRRLVPDFRRRKKEG